jgi:hypothetical protein
MTKWPTMNNTSDQQFQHFPHVGAPSPPLFGEIVLEISVPIAARRFSRFMPHFLNFLPARIIGLGAPPAPGYNAVMTRTKKNALW